jgi:hypothetical protein
MKYTVLIYESDADFKNRTASDESRQGAYWGAYKAYFAALREAGIMTGGAPLQPPHSGTTLRQRDGKRQVQDGPYADTKEQLGGFYEIDVPDLDTALQWAARCPAAASGAVEVRPTLVM